MFFSSVTFPKIIVGPMETKNPGAFIAIQNACVERGFDGDDVIYAKRSSEGG
jgi:hypothetical protein